ncbi:MAG TPA: VOC family protein [Pirellulales bacterium]|jgi:catechol 2,3-dioxygenase-like lactoylglutathione lyase family enzyme|nr:VOC family protein [Pirellulales bacterium]
MKLCERAIFTDKVDAVVNFYERLLNAKPVFRDEGIAIFREAGVQLLIHKLYQPEPQWPPCENHVGFAVSNLDEAVAELGQRGIAVEIPARNYDWGRAAYLRDPAGHLLELHEETA